MKLVNTFQSSCCSMTGARPLVAVASLALAALLTLGCQKKEAAQPPPPPAVEVTPVVQKDVPIYSQWVGTLDGYVNAVIRPQVAGYLIRQNYREGDAVRKGATLFQIDPRTFKAALDEAKANWDQQRARHNTAQANLKRIRPLVQKNALSRKDLDDAVGLELSTRAMVEAAQAEYEKARLNLDFTNITSPIDGIAGIAKAQLGDLVGPSMPTELTTVSTVNPIKAYISVSEQEYLKVQGGSQNPEKIPLELVLADGSVYPYKGRLVLADRQIDPTTGTLRVGSLFPNPGNRLRPGGYALVRAVMTVKRGALLIPQRAVTDLQGKYMVAVVGPLNKADVRTVQVGERIGSDWIINSGLKPGDQVVVEGTQKVKPGMTVNPTPAPPEKSAGAPAPAAPAPAAPAAPAAAPAPPAPPGGPQSAPARPPAGPAQPAAPGSGAPPPPAAVPAPGAAPVAPGASPQGRGATQPAPAGAGARRSPALPGSEPNPTPAAR
jgi:membrane fusion protein, multidrug efflux system